MSGVYGGAFGLGIADALGADVETVRARTVFFLVVVASSSPSPASFSVSSYDKRSFAKTGSGQKQKRRSKR